MGSHLKSLNKECDKKSTRSFYALKKKKQSIK